MYVQDGKIKLGKIYKGTIQKVNKRLFMRANKCLLSACVKTIQRFFCDYYRRNVVQYFFIFLILF